MTDSAPTSSTNAGDAPLGRANDRADEGVMSFGDHLEELRSCCIRALLGLVAATVASLVFARQILAFLLQPALVVLDAHGQRPEIQALSPPDSFMMYMKMALLSGVIIAMPWILVQAWRFIAVGLYSGERRFLRLFTPVSLALFIIGATFMFFIVLPVVLNFFVAFSEKILVPDLQPNFVQRWVIGGVPRATAAPAASPEPGLSAVVPLVAEDPVDPPPGSAWYNTTRNVFCVQTESGLRTSIMEPAKEIAAVKSQFGLSFYVGFVLMLSLAFGIAFEMPLVIIFLTSMGIVEVDALAKGRRYVILGIFVAGALLTPPDVISQLLLAIPMFLLFEGALVAARILERRRKAAG